MVCIHAYIHACIHTSLIAGGFDALVAEVLMLLRALYDFSSSFFGAMAYGSRQS